MPDDPSAAPAAPRLAQIRNFVQWLRDPMNRPDTTQPKIVANELEELLKPILDQLAALTRREQAIRDLLGTLRKEEQTWSDGGIEPCVWAPLSRLVPLFDKLEALLAAAPEANHE